MNTSELYAFFLHSLALSDSVTTAHINLIPMTSLKSIPTRMYKNVSEWPGGEKTKIIFSFNRCMYEWQVISKSTQTINNNLGFSIKNEIMLQYASTIQVAVYKIKHYIKKPWKLPHTIYGDVNAMKITKTFLCVSHIKRKCIARKVLLAKNVKYLWKWASPRKMNTRHFWGSNRRYS